MLNNNMRLIKNLLIIFILYSCTNPLDYTDEANWSKWADQEAPLSNKEIKFIDSLKNTKFPIYISRTFIGRNGFKSLNYKVEIYCQNLIITEGNVDSIILIRDEIIDELYKNIISDSVIFNMLRINTEINDFKRIDVSEKVFFPLKSYSIDSLEIRNKVKVIKINKKKYKKRRCE
jgi:hypothetical protein